MKKEHTIEREILEREAPIVLQSIPMPFGSLEKAKYIVVFGMKSRCEYSFTTTCHTTEDCIEMMKVRFGNSFKIHRVINGVKEVIFHQYKNQ